MCNQPAVKNTMTHLGISRLKQFRLQYHVSELQTTCSGRQVNFFTYYAASCYLKDCSIWSDVFFTSVGTLPSASNHIFFIL